MSDEVRASFIICNRLGLHARAAAKLAQLVANFDAQVHLECGGQRARSTSVLELLVLCGQMGAEVFVVASGVQAREAVRAVGDLIADRFGEPD